MNKRVWLLRAAILKEEEISMPSLDSKAYREAATEVPKATQDLSDPRLGFRPFGVVEQLQPAKLHPHYLVDNLLRSRSGPSVPPTADLTTVSCYPAFLLFYTPLTVTGKGSFNDCFSTRDSSQHRIASKAPHRAHGHQQIFKFTPSESILLSLGLDSKGSASAKSTTVREVQQ